MFFKRSSLSNEIESAVLADLSPEVEGEAGVGAAMESLAESASLFESAGFEEEAEAITQVMERIAAGTYAMIKEAKKKGKKKEDSHAMERGMFPSRPNPGELAPTVKKQLKNLSPKAKKKLKQMQQKGQVPKFASDCACGGKEEMESDDELEVDDGEETLA